MLGDPGHVREGRVEWEELPPSVLGLPPDLKEQLAGAIEDAVGVLDAGNEDRRRLAKLVGAGASSDQSYRGFIVVLQVTIAVVPNLA